MLLTFMFDRSNLIRPTKGLPSCMQHICVRLHDTCPGFHTFTSHTDECSPQWLYGAEIAERKPPSLSWIPGTRAVCFMLFSVLFNLFQNELHVSL